MKRKWMLLVVAALGLALMSAGSAQAIDLLNAPGPDQTWGGFDDIFCNGDPECDFANNNPDWTYWHFVAVPNGQPFGDFQSFAVVADGTTYNYGTTATDLTDPKFWIYDGSKTNNVFIKVPDGLDWTALQSATAVYAGTATGFNLSHVCVPTPEPSTLLLLGSALLGLGLTRRKVRV